ncbi:MAG TPA: hypothetical protein VL381_03365 [Rhodocyclaceae bacterium]|nr:hypothetical protein [Rhodocyclaceae bacterium]
MVTSHTTATRRLFASELDVRFERTLPGNPNLAVQQRAVAVLEKLNRDQQNQILHWVEVAAQSSYEVAMNLALQAQFVFLQLDSNGVEAWALGALEVKDREGVDAALSFLHDLDSFVATHKYAEASANFIEVEERTRTFIQALAGKYIDVKSYEYAVTDTETLFLPDVLATLPSAADNRRLYRVMASLLWAQTHYGTFTDASNLDEILARYPDADLAKEWLDALEAARLEGKLGADFPGLGAEIAELRGPWPAELAPALARLQNPLSTLADTLALLDELLASGAKAPTMVHAVSVEPMVMRAVRAQKDGDGRPAFGANQEEFEPYPAEYDDGDMGGLSGEEVDLEPGEHPAFSKESQHAGRRDEAGNLLVRKKGVSDTPPEFTYDEWDFRRGSYKKDWCHLYEVPVTPGDPNYVDEVKRKYRNYIAQIRRQLEMIKGEDKMLARQVDGEELDVDAVVESFIDRKNGGEPSDRLFRRRMHNDRSLAVMFMVDMSGSTKGWVNNAERESLILLCEALELLDDRYAIYGFSGWGHTRCEIYPIKRFDEQYGNEVRARIAGIEGKDFTRMGVAVRHLSKLLEAEPARYHLLVTISDGYPDDFGDEYRNDYGIEDTRRALQEAHERGVRSFCVTIDRQGADYLPRLYGPARYEVVPNAHKLPLRMAEIYRHLTT